MNSLLGSIDASEPCIHVLVVRLKPVAKRRTQHARRGACRTALHDEVFAIKKIGGVAVIERKRRESRIRSERCGSPFPTVPKQSLHTERAAPLRMRIHRGRIPSM